jgi:hypothetical protein
MSKRNVSDSEVDRVISCISLPSQDTDLRRGTAAWSVADFDYAIDRGPFFHRNSWDAVRGPYQSLRQERAEADARASAQEMESQRHVEITSHLRELKKPHWTVTPGFWVAFAAMVFAAIAAWPVIREWVRALLHY